LYFREQIVIIQLSSKIHINAHNIALTFEVCLDSNFCSRIPFSLKLLSAITMDVGLNDTARTVAAASRSYREIDKEHRPESGTADLVKFTSRATEGLKTKFRLMSLSWKDDDQLDTVYSIGLLIVELTKHLTRFDMVDVFERVLLPTAANDKGVLSLRSLLANYSTMTVNECRASVEHYRLYGQGYHLQNLDWSQEMLERSCEDDLRNKILEKSMDIPAIQMGGPTFLTLIMHEVTSTTEDSIRALTSRITNMKLTNFKGEDVTKAASQLRGAIAALEIVNQVPHDIVERLLDIFQTTSVVEFNATFRVMRIQQRTLGMNFVRAEIMNLAESLYSDLSSKGEWNGVANPGDDSVFLGQRETVCWDCGETGHRAGDTRCKRPKKHSQPNPDVAEKVQAPAGPSKWTAPKEGDSNEKVIDGRPYIWNAQRHRWWRKKRNTGDTANLAEVSTATTEPDDTSTLTASQAGGTTTTGARASFAAAFHAGTATAAARARSSGRRHA
jgi:hypothetical protein